MQVIEPVESLKKILAERGIGVLEQPDLVEGLMQDYCPASKPDIYLLISSLKEGVPQRLMATRSATHREAVVGQVREQMQRDLGMQPERALWTVNTWLKALPSQDQTQDPPKEEGAVDGTPVLTARQIKTDQIILRAFGFVIFPALMLFLLAQVPDLIRRMNAEGIAALWPPNRAVITGLIMGVAAMFASALTKRK